MSLVQQIGYLVFTVSDLEQWDTLTTGVLGLVKSASDEAGFSLRMDDNQQRFFVEYGAADDVTAIGFEVADAAALAQLEQRLHEAGTPTTTGGASACAKRGVSALLRCLDPAGVPLEFYYGPARASDPFCSTLVSQGFVADEQGFGHVVVTCTDPQASEHFYLQTLGFRLSDNIVLALGEHELNIVFTHINTRHHSLAFSLPLPKTIHHFMIQARAIDDVGRALDRAIDAGVQITQQLGRHSNDRMLSFYARTPSGFEFEFGADAVEIDESNWQPAVYDRGSLWGHRPPPQPAVEAAAIVPDEGTAMPVGQFVELDNGYRLHYHDQGDGEAVIFLHGSGQGASGWSNFGDTAVALRAQGVRTLLPDLLGFGYSDKPDDVQYTLALHESVLAQFISALALERVTLVGNSLGGAIALSYAMHHPQTVARLVLLAPGGLETEDVYGQMPGLQAMFRLVAATDTLSADQLRELLCLQLYDPQLLSSQMVEQRWQIALQQPKAVWTTMQVPYLAASLPSVACPLLVFWGENDQFLPVSGAQRIGQCCPQAEIEIVPRCGHWVMIEQRDFFVRRCVQFLASSAVSS